MQYIFHKQHVFIWRDTELSTVRPNVIKTFLCYFYAIYDYCDWCSKTVASWVVLINDFNKWDYKAMLKALNVTGIFIF